MTVRDAGRCGGFWQHITARCGTKLLAGGLCRAGYEKQSRRDLHSLSCIEFRESDDIYDIDFRLAKAVRECCGDYIWAVGVTAAVPNIPHRAGGVIGSPRVDIAGADAGTEYIGNGLYVRAFPEGPGCAAMCADKSVLENWDFGACPSNQKAIALAEYLRGHNVDTFLVIADGTGIGAQGMLILEIQGERLAQLSLPQKY